MSSPATMRPCPSSPPRLMRAALEAVEAGHAVFPLQPLSKKPVPKDWEATASRDPDQIRAWWEAMPYNVGIACGPSGLLVIDLDDAKGQRAPDRWSGAHHGRDVLAQRAAEDGELYPGDTYTVRTPSGQHLYFRAPVEPELRSRVGCWWRVDTRGAGGYVVAAGSITRPGRYRAVNQAAIAPLPEWLVTALTPPPPPDPVDLELPAGQASAYVAAAVDGETLAVATASTGQRHNTLLRAAARLGGLVGGGVLDQHTAETALYGAARGHIGQDGFTEREVTRTIQDGLAWGQARPRYISAEHTS
ncbi:bifunctional DNA primase/polymerase [Saccharopolyspora sp. ID03-671]|uniref:bifunctional DNA primase/polymerase n=1 Tax=Saccharopolyspora sp. ID03-671 TaxID=3073066 RepID=UPI00324ED989